MTKINGNCEDLEVDNDGKTGERLGKIWNLGREEKLGNLT